MSVRLVVVISGLVVLLGAGTVSAVTIAFDPFPIGAGAYTNDADIANQGPTNIPILGFTGAWSGNTILADLSSTTLDAPCVLESGGICKFSGFTDDATRTVIRSFPDPEYLGVCQEGDTNYWSAIVYLNIADSDGKVYVTWRDSGVLYMAVDFGISNGRLFVRLREQLSLDLGAYTPGTACHIVVRAIISGGGLGYEDTTAWVNPTRSDIIHDTNIAANNTSISFISPGWVPDKVEMTTLAISGRTACFDELLYTTEINDLNLSIQKIKSATFGPMPRPDDSGVYNHYITHDFDLNSITLESGLYIDVEGPTNAAVTGSNATWPVNGETVTMNQALAGLRVNAITDASTAEVAFATTVTNGFPGGFFVLEANGDDYDIIVTPLDENSDPIGDWSLTLSSDTLWGDNLTGEGATALRVQLHIHLVTVNGMAFTLDDFTGGSGVLTDVCGLRFVDSSPSFDPVMVGIYKRPTEDPLPSGSAFPMTSATFNRTFPDNPITNDFAFIDISTATRSWTSLVGASKANIHLPGADKLVYPENGSEPASRSAALEGLAVNGILGTGYYMELMFATPVTDQGDRIFIIEDSTMDNDQITIRPLDENRFPISTHSIEVSTGDWGGSLTPYTITYQNWGGTRIGRKVAGVLFGLSDFSGGTGTVDSVWGIRIENSDGDVDLMVVGRTRETGTLILIH
ncbi:MAG: hypothetical protein PF904_15485 [Kiritimatiellae bacterium]|nr:hypothetical protein [Kiritimatiellia bacterium]